MFFSKRLPLCILAFIVFLIPRVGLAGFFDRFENMIDPNDGKLDMSDYLASARGFLPVPIIITEPAIGYGFGLAVAYYHKPTEVDPDLHKDMAPPSITVGFGAKTENGTYMLGAVHRGIWKKDRIRYLGAIAKADVFSTVYTSSSADSGNGLEFNLDGALLNQQLQFRIKDSNWWLGTNYLYVSSDNTFQLPDEVPGDFPNPGKNFDLGALGVFVEYDSRNTTFTPTMGIDAKFEFQSYDDTWGSDFDYRIWDAFVLHYTPIGDYSSLGLRLEGEGATGDVPYFAYPYVALRGIPVLRYQGKEVLTVEAEYLWGLTPRWTLVLFGGVGKTSAIESYNNEGDTVGAGGVGFRYRLARKMGLQAGIDIARGPEDTSFYITVGSAWSGR